MKKSQKKENPRDSKKNLKGNRITKLFLGWAYGLWLTLKFFVYALALGLSTLFVAGMIYGFSVYQGFARDFDIENRKSNSTQNVIHDKEGGLVYESFGAKSPAYRNIDEISDIVKNATLAAEDSEFYTHGAIDPKGLLRAAILNIRSSEKSGVLRLLDLFSESNYTQGGSSITQQLVKNIYLSSERSFERKIREIVYSFELEKKLSKNEIFEEYLNNVYYGEQALGIENAAYRFFGKESKDLTLSEASLLAGLTASPSVLSPISGDFSRAKERQAYVLSNMYLKGMITAEEARGAIEEPLYFNTEKEELHLRHPYYVDLVKKEAELILGSDAFERGGFIIETHLDPERQAKAEEITAKYIERFKYRRVTNAAAVVLDNKEGTIAALVGGVDWEKSKVNVALAKRQPGSSFKPIVYLSGLMEGYTAASRLSDVYVNFGGIPPYIPRNYDGGYRGNVTVRSALANSLNIPAVQMAKLVGVEKVMIAAEKLGIKSIDKDPGNYGLSIALGSAEVTPLELTSAYSVFANAGKLANFSTISEIKDATGTVIYRQPMLKSEVIDPRLAYIMSDILSDNTSRSLVFGTNSPLYSRERRVAAKTGTTDDYADSWTMGYTPQYTIGVWMGNNDRTKMARISGVEGAAYIWQELTRSVHDGLVVEDFEIPEGLSQAWISPYTQAQTNAQRRPNINEYFIPGTEPGPRPDFSYLNQFFTRR